MIASDRNPAASVGRGCSRAMATMASVARLRLFASAREAAGTGRDRVPGATVREVLEEACDRYGHDFAGLLETCQVWCNGEPTAPNAPVGDDDEIAVLPPVSGG
ncbi:MAG: MoaD/ThiS family protein [Acidimicrobiaceae bacterium]|nr:MoaD/ThiS family protein [Acidimicrobiaceae bacterium]MYH78065.1 MoaD/ThiS family protein [Acidimicrobiaceae bacterium]MYK77452.1 MoaD/ThiS family protein [Acidimicrobiaceae bacterium]